jgi:thiamine-monophosphate kinase
MLCEGVHFLSDEDPKLIGRKALAVNLSDIAAMGGRPTLAVLAFAIPPERGASYALDIVRGAQSLAEEFGVQLCGGDSNRSLRDVNVSVTLLGDAQAQGAILRSGAQVGDAIVVTGKLGASFESRKHLLFQPRVKEALFLNQNYKVHAMTDISDGLARDLGNILEASHCGAVLFADAIPVSEILQSLSKEEKLKRALSDGEDFELVFTMSERDADALTQKDSFYTKVGSIIETPGLFWSDRSLIEIQGYIHNW